MKKVGFLLAGILSLLFLVNACSAVEFTITPETKVAHPGQTVSYGMKVNLSAADLEHPELFPILEEFEIDPDNSQPGWGYNFSRDNVTLDDLTHTNNSVLYITVPPGTPTGNYSHGVTATGYDKDGQEYGFPTDFDIYVVNTDVQIPEFPSIALPVAAVLGLVAVFGRKKEI